MHSAFVGFDGFLDRLARVVRSRSGETVDYFPNIASFAARLSAAAGLSADLELDVLETKPGGNAPLMARTLAVQGAQVTCAAAVGMGDVLPAFQAWARHMLFLPVGMPGDALVLEFDDGKIMLPDLKPMDELTWEAVRLRAGDEALRQAARNHELFALVNWSLLRHASSIWAGFRDEYLRAGTKGRAVSFFFDLADPSKHAPERLRECLALIASFRALGRVTLGLNENEGRRLAAAALGSGEGDLPALAEGIRALAVADVVLIHPRNGCALADEAGSCFLPGQVAPHPRVSTGGGDAFNAGYCFGCMTALSSRDAALLGIRRSYLHVTGNGDAPT